jgi:hypothetical protein
MTKYTLNKGQQGENVLMIDGRQSFCPFVDPIPMQGQVGQIQLMRLPCNTNCPHAELDNRGTYHITCGSEKVSFVISEADNSKSDILTVVE